MKCAILVISMAIAGCVQGQSPNPSNPNLGEPWDNVWNHNNPANNYKVDGTLAIPGQPIIWYHRGADDPNNPLSPNPHAIGLVDPRPYQSITGTADCASQHQVFNRDKALGAAVGDSAGFDDYASEFSYQYKMYVYDVLRKNDTLLSLGTPADASFQQFFADLAETNIGLLDLVKQALDSNLVDTAAARNQTVVDTNSIEFAGKTVNTILTEKVLKGIALNASDTAALESLASQHWLTAGKAVYEAAATLGIEYHPPAVSLRSRRAAPDPGTASSPLPLLQVAIQPNPAADMVTISRMKEGSNVIGIFDCSMRQVYKASHAGSSAQVSLAPFARGVYQIRISSDEGVYHSSRVVLIK